MSDEVVTRQVEGTLAGVNFGSEGWKEYAIDVGRQYPVKLSTKQPDVQQAAEAAHGQKAVWTFTERDGNPNPHKPGTYYKNRYLGSVTVGGTLDPALAGQTASSNAPTGGGNQGGSMPTEGREVSIERQTLVKAVLALVSDFEFKDEDGLFKFLDRLDDWMGRTRGGQPAAADALPAQGLPAGDEDPNDDIPF